MGLFDISVVNLCEMLSISSLVYKCEILHGVLRPSSFTTPDFAVHFPCAKPGGSVYLLSLSGCNAVSGIVISGAESQVEVNKAGQRLQPFISATEPDWASG